MVNSEKNSPQEVLYGEELYKFRESENKMYEEIYEVFWEEIKQNQREKRKQKEMEIKEFEDLREYKKKWTNA
jgi:hypothetical protein